MAGEGVDGVEAHAGPSRDDLSPPIPARVVLGRLHQTEVLGLVVGHDEEAGAASGHRVAEVVVDAVLDTVATRFDHPELAIGVVGREHVDLGGHLGLETHDHEPVVLGA